MHVPSTMGTGTAAYGHVRGATVEDGGYARTGSALGSARMPGAYGGGTGPLGRGATPTGVNGLSSAQAVVGQHTVGVAGGIGGNAGEDRREKRGFWAVLCCR